MDVQKTMEFILEQQAASVVLMNRLTEAQRNAKRNVSLLTVPLNTRTKSRAKSDPGLYQLEERVRKTSQLIREAGVKIDALVALAATRNVAPL